MVSEPSEAAKKGNSPGIRSDNYAQTTCSLEIGGVYDGGIMWKKMVEGQVTTWWN